MTGDGYEPLSYIGRVEQTEDGGLTDAQAFAWWLAGTILFVLLFAAPAVVIAAWRWAL